MVDNVIEVDFKNEEDEGYLLQGDRVNGIHVKSLTAVSQSGYVAIGGKGDGEITHPQFLSMDEMNRFCLMWLCIFDESVIKEEWTSVKDRLPEKGDYYLVTDGEVVFQLGYSIAGLWTSNDGNPEPISGITHWQPLPPPPTK